MSCTRTRAITHNCPYAFYFLSLGEFRFYRKCPARKSLCVCVARATYSSKNGRKLANEIDRNCIHVCTRNEAATMDARCLVAPTNHFTLSLQPHSVMCVVMPRAKRFLRAHKETIHFPSHYGHRMGSSDEAVVWRRVCGWGSHGSDNCRDWLINANLFEFCCVFCIMCSAGTRHKNIDDPNQFNAASRNLGEKF